MHHQIPFFFSSSFVCAAVLNAPFLMQFYLQDEHLHYLQY